LQSSKQEVAITTHDLTKRFGEKLAVDRVNFDVRRGEVFGFLGPNGAGKTTTIKMLTTLVPPSSGGATVLGYDLRSQPKKIRERIGVVQQQDSFDQGLKVETSLDIYGFIWDTPKEERKRRIKELVERFGMEEFRRKPTVDLSAGQRRRLQVAREFMHDMDLLYLDEPTVGLDPIARRSVLNFFKEKVANEGLTIFFTTHILEEAEYLCDRIAIINLGRIIQVDTPENLKRRFGRAKAVEFKLLEGISPALAAALEGSEYVSKMTEDRENGSYRISTMRPESVIPEVYGAADKLGLHVTSIYISETSLEDAFVSLVSDSNELGEARGGVNGYSLGRYRGAATGEEAHTQREGDTPWGEEGEEE
jgi:ABC-2 type transport system ATP-binding protein